MPDSDNSPASSLALLVLDMQEPFLKAMPDREALIIRTTFAISAARLLGIRVFFTEQNPDKLGPTHPELLSRAGQVNTVFAKDTFGALDAPGLTETLTQTETTHLLLSGLEVPVCIYQTALQALEMEVGVTILYDAVSGRRPVDFPPVFSLLRENGVCVLPTETVYYSILQTAKHPEFRNFTALVKEASRISL